jgi:hypothetical protein
MTEHLAKHQKGRDTCEQRLEPSGRQAQRRFKPGTVTGFEDSKRRRDEDTDRRREPQRDSDS